MPQVRTTATFTDSQAYDDGLNTIVARSVLEAALEEGDQELWFDIELDDETKRLSVDVSTTDLEEMLRLSGGDDVLLSLDSGAVAGLFDAPDVEAHGLRSSLAIAVSGAALLAPAGQAALQPQAVSPAATAQRASVAATAQDRPAATAQVSSLAARVQAKPQAKTLVLKANGFKLLRSPLAR